MHYKEAAKILVGLFDERQVLALGRRGQPTQGPHPNNMFGAHTLQGMNFSTEVPSHRSLTMLHHRRR